MSGDRIRTLVGLIERLTQLEMGLGQPSSDGVRIGVGTEDRIELDDRFAVEFLALWQ